MGDLGSDCQLHVQPATARGPKRSGGIRQGWRQEREDEGRQGEERDAYLYRGVQSVRMEVVPEQCDDHCGRGQRGGFAAAIRGCFLRKRLRPADGQQQRPTLVRRRQEAVLATS